MSSRRWKGVLLAILVIGAFGGMGYWIYTLQEDLVAARSALTSLDSRTSTAESEISDVEATATGMTTRLTQLERQVGDIPPAFDPGSINARLSNLRIDVDVLDADVSALYDYLEDNPGVQKPAFCFAGDTVFWGYGGALTC